MIPTMPDGPIEIWRERDRRGAGLHIATALDLAAVLRDWPFGPGRFVARARRAVRDVRDRPLSVHRQAPAAPCPEEGSGSAPGPSADDLIRRYRAGETLASIAAATGLAPSTVRYRLKRAGVELRPARRARGDACPDLPDAEVVRRYQAGQSCYAIAAATGIPRTTVYARLKRAGVELRPTGPAPGYGRRDLGDQAIIERYRAGESCESIGRSLGVSAQAIRERLIEAGVERRRSGGRGGSRPREPIAEAAMPDKPQPDEIPVPVEPDEPSIPPPDFPEIPKPHEPLTPYPVHPVPAPTPELSTKPGPGPSQPGT